MAHIVIVGIGTRGDVVPLAALGAALAAGGDRVTVVTHASLRAHVDEAGLGFAALPVEFGAGRPLSSARFARLLAARWPDVGEAVLAASRDADLLLLSPMGWLGYHVAQATGARSMGVFLQPLEPTVAFPPPLLTTRSLGGWGNRAAAHAFRVLGQMPFARANAAFRRRLGLPPLGSAAMFRQADEERWPVLYGFSPSVVPAPPDWPPYRPITGYWWPRVTGGLSPALRRFLDDGDPPVFIGFGSLDAPRLRAVVEETATRLGRRVVVQTGAAGLTAAQRNVLVVGDEPHELLFPRTAMVVHHGGAGTTAAAMRAGVPSVIVPFTADQPFWAHRAVALGAAPAPIPLRRATPRKLRDAIAVADSYRTGAAALSRSLAAEDGIAAAVAEIRREMLPVQ